jgi:hypothetical protein
MTKKEIDFDYDEYKYFKTKLFERFMDDVIMATPENQMFSSDKDDCINMLVRFYNFWEKQSPEYGNRLKSKIDYIVWAVCNDEKRAIFEHIKSIGFLEEFLEKIEWSKISKLPPILFVN